MIEAAIIAFTEKGLALGETIKAKAQHPEYSFEIYAKYENFIEDNHKNVTFVTENLMKWTLDKQSQKYALVFVGAMGIAVRAIAAGLESKVNDSPVIVVDELGLHVIPVAAGHLGGANEMSVYLAKIIGANPVITTATDLEEAFSVDLFAKENNLWVYNKEGIAKVSAKALERKAVRLSIENYPPEAADVIISRDKALKGSCDLLLCPKSYAVGIGCKKGTSGEKLKAFFLKVLEENHIDINDVGAVASINLKTDEAGLIELCSFFRLPFITFTAELLNKAKGEFEESEFVKEKTGVGNVCERAAMLLTENKGVLLQKKYALDGMTMAIAKME